MLLGHFLHEETFNVEFLVTQREETCLFQKRSDQRVFFVCFFICFRNKLGTPTIMRKRNKGWQISEQSGPLAKIGT